MNQHGAPSYGADCAVKLQTSTGVPPAAETAQLRLPKIFSAPATWKFISTTTSVASVFVWLQTAGWPGCVSFRLTPGGPGQSSTAQAAAPLDRRSGAAALLLVLASMGLRVRTRRRPNLR